MIVFKNPHFKKISDTEAKAADFAPVLSAWLVKNKSVETLSFETVLKAFPDRATTLSREVFNATCDSLQMESQMDENLQP